MGEHERDIHGQLAAVERLVPAIEPGPFRALIESAMDLERQGQARAAAAAYRTALQSIPRFLSPVTRAVLDHAKARVEANDIELEQHLSHALKDLRDEHIDGSLARVDAALDILLRKRRVYRPSPSFMYIPELAPIEFHDRAQFPWLDALEAATDSIRAELIGLMSDQALAPEPYVQVDGEPEARWRDLANSTQWGVFFLWKAGEPQDQIIARCPRTVEALSGWPRCDLEGTGPTAVFSILQPRTRIPPHVGVNNARLIVHVPLIVPGDCGIRVGGQTRAWRPGEAFAFDDTIEHEAWNDSDQPRAVLILDTWNPALSTAERAMITAATAAVSDYYGELPAYARGAGG